MDTDRIRVLLAGESWTSHTVHVKGFDSFTTSEYQEGAGWLIQGLTEQGIDVEFMPNHEANTAFPTDLSSLQGFDVVMLSDIGSNTLLLPPNTFKHSQPSADRCRLLADFVRGGGGLAMIGGYFSFSGIDGKARYQRTALNDVLPVTLVEGDDRVEAPQGVQPAILEAEHALFGGIDGHWPRFLGYNQLRDKQGCSVLASADDDVFIAVGTFGEGRSAAFASDCGPHWGPPEFVEWTHYGRFWGNLVRWLAQR